MRAIVTKGHGDVSVMHAGEAPRPVLADGGVRIRVRTAGVNRADLLQREGHYPPPSGASELLGLEVAGEVIESTVSAWKKGDAVMALLAGGGYAEEVVVDAGSVMRKPEALSWDEAGAFPETFLTAFLNVFEIARAKPGESLLIHGGGSGVGTSAITLGKLAQLRVIATAGSDEKCKRCREHGADDAINYRTEDFVARAKEVDVILDHIGGLYLVRDLQTLATGGRIVIIGSMGGREPVMLDVAAILRKRQSIIGSTLRARPALEKTAIVEAFLDRFGKDLEAGRIRPVIDTTFPLDRVADAHRRIEADHFGKVVLNIS